VSTFTYEVGHDHWRTTARGLAAAVDALVARIDPTHTYIVDGDRDDDAPVFGDTLAAELRDLAADPQAEGSAVSFFDTDAGELWLSPTTEGSS